ncbi:hypothetical protein COU15_02785 [Candidatus Kaiserbacteria bacterium CG10_big_fil_rev_8_21_14_0_10_45_20]|uniref:Uncharacterized protein n=1 Tax=Candidatus Kaiserbacteria bacterium CG10_big_fil_rev_8_21_14_0_10_45_20 TaxID=1974607 RepID=A0A2H0UGZ5_9BACT|nr:MAG: hypothetical protein COU15_02785 [Candidatus Kaiserbacteria bacterium CG10_big_fil_rev_8_21_14_0_10_45_20]
MKLFFFIGTAIAVVFLFAPQAFADFVGLAPIPNLDTSEGATLSSYLNSLFNFAIAMGAILAVLMLVRSGFTYMTSDALSQKSDARTQIQSAITGLILLLLSWLFLEIINPNLLNLDLFRNLNSGSSAEPTGDPFDTTTNPVQSGTTDPFSNPGFTDGI